MHVGEQQQLLFATEPPQSGIAITVELNGSALISARIEVIIAGEPRHFSNRALPPTEEKGAALTPPLSPLMKGRDQACP